MGKEGHAISAAVWALAAAGLHSERARRGHILAEACSSLKSAHYGHPQHYRPPPGDDSGELTIVDFFGARTIVSALKMQLLS